MPTYDRTDDEGLLSETINRIAKDVREQLEQLDDKRLSAIRADRDGIWQVVDDIFTKAEAEKLSMEDVHRVIAKVRGQN